MELFFTVDLRLNFQTRRSTKGIIGACSSFEQGNVTPTQRLSAISSCQAHGEIGEIGVGRGWSGASKVGGGFLRVLPVCKVCLSSAKSLQRLMTKGNVALFHAGLGGRSRVTRVQGWVGPQPQRHCTTPQGPKRLAAHLEQQVCFLSVKAKRHSPITWYHYLTT